MDSKSQHLNENEIIYWKNLRRLNYDSLDSEGRFKRCLWRFHNIV